MGFTYKQILSFYYPQTKLVSNYNDDVEDEATYERKVLEEIRVRVELALKELEKGLE